MRDVVKIVTDNHNLTPEELELLTAALDTAFAGRVIRTREGHVHTLPDHIAAAGVSVTTHPIRHGGTFLQMPVEDADRGRIHVQL